jgi:hypothetical protein
VKPNNRLRVSQAVAAAMMCLAPAAPLFADLLGYWPLDAAPGGSSPNTVAGGSPAVLNGAATIATDPTRGSVLELNNTAGTYANAGTLPNITPTQDFTWAFWSRHTQANPPAEQNDVILGNRMPNAGWIKFTPANFEYRDITPTFDNGINVPDLTQALGWTHNAVVKTGDQMIYYRNGIATGFNRATGTVNAPPFYMGGDAAAGENWGGQLDDVAVWNNAMPVSSVRGIARGQFTPANAPLTGTTTPPILLPRMSDNFDAPALSPSWTVTDRGLEQNAPAGYNPPDLATNPGRLTLGGTATNQFWYGRSVETTASFSSALDAEVGVDRVALTGTAAATAYRSSLWIYGDAGHYLHFSQNRKEGGWSFNANDVGGFGTNNPTGVGVNIPLLDSLDLDEGAHRMKIALTPGDVPGAVSMAMYLDDNLVAIQGFSNFPAEFKVILTGQARATGDTMSAVFDNFHVAQAVPEPSTIMLAAAAAGLLASRASKRRSS